MSLASRNGTTNRLSFASVLGNTYTLQYKNSLTDTIWTSVPPSTNGTEGAITLLDPTANGSTRFYRLSIQ